MKTRCQTLALLLILVTALAPTPVQGQVGSLLWEENFDTLDPDRWTVDTGDGCNQGLCGWGNAELQSYGESNVTIEPVPGEPGNSALVLEARAESAGGAAFTSGKIKSENKLAVQYGMVEIRMRVPNLETGLWPAAWMLGTSTATWPAKGEIDIMEMGHSFAARDRQGYGSTTPNFYVGSNLIFYADEACVPENPTCAASSSYDTTYNTPYAAATSMADRFLVYRLYWTDTDIQFSVTDGGVEHYLHASPFQVGGAADEFQAPFFFLLNLAVGGNFTDAASNGQVTAPLPARMYVDYIRVYEYNGLGQVISGNVTPPESGTFGVFTDLTPTTSELVAGSSSDIWVWDPTTTAGSTPPLEGSEVIAWNVQAGGWFGGGIQSRQPRDMSNFDGGNLRFSIRIPADVAFRVGITDTYTNEHWITFPAGQTTYGLVRNGQWGEAVIPVADLRGPLVAIQSLSYLFAIAADPPASTFELGLDDIYWQGGGTVDPDSDGDGVPDSQDQCPGTAAGTPVDSVGCPISQAEDVQVEAEDYDRYADSDAGNNGGAYRTDDVDIEASSDTGGGFNVGWTVAGEWLEYDVTLAPGTYDVSARVASDTGGGAYSLSLGGTAIGSGTVGDTGGWQAWQSHAVGSVTVASGGVYTLRVDISGGNFNLNWIAIDVAGSGPVDSDGDGVDDASDQCPGTPAGTPVDAVGCPLPSSTTGLMVTGADAIEFFVDTSAWADVHYTINGGAQQNVRMVQAGGRNTHTLSGLSNGDVIVYSFTYWDASGGFAVGTQAETFTFTGGGTQPSDVQVEAEDYTTYADSDAGNNGGAYRTDDVDIEATTDAGGGHNVGWTASGEWLEYSVTLEAGSYTVSARVASLGGGGGYTVSLGGATVGSASVADTGGWQSWQSQTLGTVNVGSGGTYTLRVDIGAAGFNLNWIRFDAN